MNRFERQITIHSDPETIFDYVSDLQGHHAWATNPLTITVLTPGPIAVGTEFRADMVVMRRSSTDTGTVTCFDRPTRFAFTTRGPAGTVENWFEIRPQGDGTCTLVKGSVNPEPSRFSIVMVPVLRLAAPRWYDRNLRTIRNNIEHPKAACSRARPPDPSVTE